ncbi:hypothetical protein HYW41_03780 [Candidatus Daviesbacteria bacterium]|nr:hypothetical protein [Candidatus Daviesbacteria bacterium]
MDDPRWLRIVTVGLILASLAVGYFLLTGGFSSKPRRVQPQNTQVSNSSSSPSPYSATLGTTSPFATTEPEQTTIPSAYSRIVERNQSNIQALPATGFPAGLAVVFSVGTIITGWSLRKYPQ